MTGCYRHPSRAAYVRCQRCGRPVCPECQIPAAVGVQCPDCVRQAVRQMPRTRSALGAPISDGAPVVTITMIGLCVIAFVAQLATGVTGGRVTQELIMAPMLAWHEPWRMITGAFLHGGVMHLLLNMYALWVVGSFMEQVLGRSRLVALYLGSALGGNAMVLIYFRLFDFTPQTGMSGTLGASGAVFGLFAATLIAGRRLGGNMSGIVAVIGINLVLSFTISGISWQGHIGGLVAGGLMALIYVHAPPSRRELVAWLVPLVTGMVMVGIVILTASPWSAYPLVW